MIEQLIKELEALKKRVEILEGGPVTVKTKRPNLEALKAYFKEKGQPNEAEKFWDFYESKGWKVGKNPMKAWKSAVNNWIRRNNEGRNGQNNNTIKPKAGKYSGVPAVRGDN